MSTRLYDLVGVDRAPDGIQRATEVAALRVGLVHSPDAQSIEEKLRHVRPQVLGAQLKKMLDVDLLELLAGAWGQVRKVRDAATESLRDPPTEHTVALPGHTFEAALRPRLVVSVGGVNWSAIDFELSVSAALTSVTLHIAAGKLIAVQLGQVTGSVRFSCEGTELSEYARELSLMPEHRLDPPISIVAAGVVRDAGTEL
jgi:hypothetical protein